ncbi:GmrSD restriction endonuclease domain-containing protein [Lachnoanaerobaculum saburreum]|uniref:DUF262 domain-containing protein n=1 Tax=Lachnoanaerobaculum saburreum TaxID=467210 RepID=A0A133ZXS7_9FIRM|nr:DUF262 domain-containing protein [Lachnoanaerobaculum saburreum]KXB60244.1 hypothetical protein HMPREF1866_00670 [Lachnoanaerobaculum saburreum]
MGFPIDSKVLGLRDIIKERYRIPIYQRPYEWAEKNINDFLNTIFEAFSTKSEVDAGKYEKSVFFGTIQFNKETKDANILDIVDGQQRLTTFLLLLDVLQKEIIKNDPGEKNNDYSNTIDSEELKKVLSETQIKKVSSKYSKNKEQLRKATSEYYEQEFKDKTNFYSELKDFVLDNIYFVILTTEEMDLPEVVSVFNTINTTGLDLNATDIFKLRYYNYLRKIDDTDNWMKEIANCYKLIDDSNNALGLGGRKDQTEFNMSWVLDIYKHIICAEFGWGFSEVSKSNEKFFDELFKGTKLEEQSDLSVLEFSTFKHIVEEFIKYWRWIEDVRYNCEHPEVAKEIFSIYMVEKTRYKRYWTIPFVVAYFKAKGKSWSNYYIDSLRVNMYMFRFFLIYTVVNDRVINPVQNKVCDDCFKWFKECSTDEIIKNLRDILWSPVRSKDYEPKEDFYKTIKLGLFYNASRVSLVCTLSGLLDEIVNLGKSFIYQGNEVLISEQEIYEKFFHYAIYEKNKNPYDIEHIKAKENFKDDKDNIDEFNGIGNLVVLDSRINRAIKDKDVSEKLEHYENSQYAAVRIEFMKEYESLRDWDIEAVRERAEKEIKKIESFMNET